jgi:hypothetical protein
MKNTKIRREGKKFFWIPLKFFINAKERQEVQRRKEEAFSFPSLHLCTSCLSFAFIKIGEFSRSVCGDYVLVSGKNYLGFIYKYHLKLLIYSTSER